MARYFVLELPVVGLAAARQPEPRAPWPVAWPIAADRKSPGNPGTQTRKSPIPVPPIPDLAGKRAGNPRFPIRPGPGNGAPIGRKSGNRGYPSV